MRQLGLLDRIKFAFRGSPGVVFRATKGGPYYMSSPNEYLRQLFRAGGAEVAAGVTVDEESALGSSAYLASVKVLSETLASLPAIMYRRLPEGQGKRRATDHPMYRLLHQAVGPDMTSYQFKERMQAAAVLRGDAYAQIIPDSSGYPAELVPLDTHRMAMKKADGRISYVYRPEGGGEPRTFRSEQIFHLSGFGVHAQGGLKMVPTMRESLGITLAAQLYGASFFGNSANAGGVIEVEHSMTDPAYKRLKEDWAEKHRGAENAHKVAILEDGAKWHQITIPPDQAQYLETRRFQVTEAARPHRVPPHLVGDLERSTFSNIEHQSLEFIIYTMLPWITRWEQAIWLQLIPEWDREEYFCEFLVDVLVRGDLLSRMNAYRIAREIGLYSANDIRNKENENPVEGGDVYHVPLNWVPVDQSGRDEEQGLRSKGVHEAEAQRSASVRGRIAEAYQPVYEDTFRRIVLAQETDLSAAVAKYLRGRDLAGFNTWLDEYLVGQPEFIRSRIAPVYGSITEAIRAEISAELGSDLKLTPANEAFVRSYVGRFVDSYVKSTRNQIDSIVAAHPVNGDELPDALDKRIAGWKSTRAKRTAKDQTVRASNAMAKMFYAGAGIMYLRWYARGSKSCPLCQKLNGQIVGIHEAFVSAGDSVDAGGKRLRARRKCAHAPLHEGCTCRIGPG